MPFAGDIRNASAGPRSSPECAWVTAYCDGGSRGNPGPAGYGVYVQDDQGNVVGELSQYLGIKTNNFAEYSGLIASLEFAVQNRYPCLRVVSDSELMVKQMKGQYRVNSPDLRLLHERARRLALELKGFEIRHVLREKNRHADRLANLAMDRGGAKAPREAGGQRPERARKAPAEGDSTEKKQILRGRVKDGVVHVLGGELPEGVFVKLIPE